MTKCLILKDSELQRHFDAMGTELKPSTPGGLMQLASRDRQKWARIINDSGIKTN